MVIGKHFNLIGASQRQLLIDYYKRKEKVYVSSPSVPLQKGEEDFCFPPFACAEASAKAHSGGTEEGLREVTVFLFLSFPSVPLRRGRILLLPTISIVSGDVKFCFPLPKGEGTVVPHHLHGIRLCKILFPP